MLSAAPRPRSQKWRPKIAPDDAPRYKLDRVKRQRQHHHRVLGARCGLRTVDSWTAGLPVVLEYLSCRHLQETGDVSILEREMRCAPLLLPALTTSYGNARH